MTSSRVTVLCVSVCLIGFGDFGLRWPRFLAGLFLATLDATLKNAQHEILIIDTCLFENLSFSWCLEKDAFVYCGTP